MLGVFHNHASLRRKKVMAVAAIGSDEQRRKREDEANNRPSLRLIGAYVPEALYDQIREITKEEHSTIQAFIREAVNTLLVQKEKPPFSFPPSQLGRPCKAEY